MSIKRRLKNIDDTVNNLPYFSGIKYHFLTWREGYFMTPEEREAMLDPHRQNLVIFNLPTKEDYEEYGDILEAERLAHLEEKKKKRGW